MIKVFKTLFLSVLLPLLSYGAEAAEDFFEFSTGGSLPAPFETLLAEHADASVTPVGTDFESALLLIDGAAVLRADMIAGELETQALTSLPIEFPSVSTALVGDVLYVFGDRSLFRLDLSDPASGWVACAMLPVESEDVTLASQFGHLYLAGAGAGGRALYTYDPFSDAWTALAESTEDMRGFIGAACGNDHILYFNSSRSDDRIIAYHRVTNTWFTMGHLPAAVQAIAIVSQNSEFSLLTRSGIVHGEAKLRATKYGLWDHLVVAALVILLVGVGVYFSRKEKSSGDYFRGGNKIPWWAAGLSLFATGASAISLMAMPGKSFAENWIYFSISLMVVVVQLPLFLFVYIPIARRLKISTANEYLERRFSLPVRMLGFVCFSLNQMLGRMAAILLLPAIAISAIFGLPMEYSILIMGVVTTLFVTMGGLAAVIWTDVLQAIIMLLAVLVCAAYAAFGLELSLSASMEILSHLDKLRLFDFSFDWRAPVFIVILLNTVASVLGVIGDQNFIQRVQCTQDEKDSRKAIYTQLAVAVPMNFVLFALGTLLFLFYSTRADTLSPALKGDGVFPFFAAQNLPAGLAGFVVVALLAATISTVSSAMNSVADLGVQDVYRRFFPNVTDHKCLIVGRYLTFGLGVFGTGSALLLANLNSLQSVWDLFIMITGMVLAPITGIFVLGIFTRRANNFGVWAGTVASLVANYYATFHMDVHPMVYLSVGVFSCIFVGYLASYLAPKPTCNLDGLTAFSLLKKKD